MPQTSAALLPNRSARLNENGTSKTHGRQRSRVPNRRPSRPAALLRRCCHARFSPATTRAGFSGAANGRAGGTRFCYRLWRCATPSAPPVARGGPASAVTPLPTRTALAESPADARGGRTGRSRNTPLSPCPARDPVPARCPSACPPTGEAEGPFSLLPLLSPARHCR
jgi:hypothetical protein